MPLLSENLPPSNPSPPSLQWPRAKALLSTQGLSQNQMPSRSATICDSLTFWVGKFCLSGLEWGIHKHPNTWSSPTRPTTQAWGVPERARGLRNITGKAL